MTNPIAFDNVYLNDVWGYKSGPGSDPTFAKPWIDQVNYFLSRKDVKTVIDIGCGDWRIGKCLNLEGKDYTGIDISSIILKETSLNATENIKFIHGDFETLETHDADLIIIKDVLQHLTNASIYNIINKIMGKAKYALICDDLDRDNKSNNNADIMPGHHRFIDISAEPFNFNFIQLGYFKGKNISLYIRDEER
jgi:SAM-dependent methyltransferase